MTVCNMTIEAGARAGMIAPDETTFAYLEGRPGRAQRRRAGTRRSSAGARCAPTPAPSSTARSRSTWPRLAAGHLGHEPRHGRADRRQRPRPRRLRRPADREAAERALHYMGLEPGTPIAGDPDRPRLHRLVHERADRGPARGRRGRRGPQVAAERARDGRPRLGRGEAPGRGTRASTASSSTPASSGARPAARCASA